MRKEQNFVIYPVSESDQYIKIQSDGRFGFIDKSGRLLLTSKNVNYPTSAGLISECRCQTAVKDQLTEDELNSLREFFKNNATAFFGNSVVEVMGNTGLATF